MDFKPSDFFVGVIDFFAVLLPGTIVAAVLAPYVGDTLFGPTGFLPRPKAGAETWLALLVGGYLVGHVLFLLGALLDTLLYEPLRRKAVPSKSDKDKAYNRAAEVKSSLLAPADDAALNTFQWARATLQLRAPATVVEIERYEADSKFFRSLSVALYGLMLVTVGRLVFQAGQPRGDVSFWATTEFAMAIALLAWLVVARLWRALRDERYRKQNPEAPEPPEKEAPLFWPVTGVIGLILFGSALVLSLKDQEQPLILLVLWGLAVWRYAERRWKSTRTANQYAVILYRQALPPEQGGKSDQPASPGSQ